MDEREKKLMDQLRELEREQIADAWRVLADDDEEDPDVEDDDELA